MKTKKIVSLLFFILIYLSANAAEYTLNQQSGSFSVSGTNYTNNMSEVWYINTGVNQPILFNYNISTESGYDYVYIYSIDSNGNISSNPIASYSGSVGSGQLSTLVPSGRAKVVFTSDGSVCNDAGYYGFLMSFSINNTQSTQLNGGSISIGTTTVTSGYSPGTFISVPATGGSGSYNYLWEQSFDNVNWTSIASGEYYTVPNLQATTYYRRTVSDGSSTPLTTDPVCINVIPPGTSSVSWSSITSKPTTVSGFGITDAMTTSHPANAITSAYISVWNAKQGALTLTTTGTSGVATLSGNTLNIPQYTTASGGLSQWTTSGSNIYYTTGSVGIGTTTPSTILQIVKNDASTNQSLTNTAALDIWNTSGGSNTGGQINFRSDVNSGAAGVGAVIGYLNKGSNASSGSVGDLVFGVKNNQTDASIIQAITIQHGGNVGIGTTSPDALLTVNGTIHAREVNIALSGPLFPDFVFDENYKLMPLHQVEQYVKTNNHLPDIPSANEVGKSGLNIGEMQNKLLQKVEELTLYVIEQQKTINLQNEKIQVLEKKVR